MRPFATRLALHTEFDCRDDSFGQPCAQSGREAPPVQSIRFGFSGERRDSLGHLMQKLSWLIQPMGVLMQQHLQTLADYPPVQGGPSFDMSNVVGEFINKAQQ